LTLVELLIALAMSSVVLLLAMGLFRDVGFAARLAGGKRDAAFEAQAAFSALSDNLMEGGGILKLGPGEAELLNRRNRRVTYAWDDSVLKANGKAYRFRLASLEAVPSGPVKPAWQAFSAALPWELDSLDADGDGRIDFEELDRDRSGFLDAEECRFVASIRVTLTAEFRGEPLVLTALVHPRNRVPARVGEDARDIETESGVPAP
jgi:hypothetical protein